VEKLVSKPLLANATCTATLRRAGEGRKAAMYPWFEEHARLGTMDGWVQCLSFNFTHKVGGAVRILNASNPALHAALKLFHTLFIPYKLNPADP
jgi:hypothetical protein